MAESPITQYWNQIDARLHPQLRQLLSTMHKDKTKDIPYSTIESELMPVLADAFIDGVREVTAETDVSQAVSSKYVQPELIQKLMSGGGKIRNDFITDLCTAVNFLYYASRMPIYAGINGQIIPVENLS